MFGYVGINQDELKLKDYRRYRGFYCGLCRELKVRDGRLGQITLSYDLTFTAVLLTALFEEPLTEESRRCPAHPKEKQLMLRNRYTAYMADMSILMAYYKADDNWRDDHDRKARFFQLALKKRAEEAAGRWPVQDRVMRENLAALTRDEKDEVYDLDRMASYTGNIMAEILSCDDNEWRPELGRLGFFLGKFVYLMDAYDDLEKDGKKGSYNPWIPYRDREDFDKLVEKILTMMLGECSTAFERLPILQDTDILRNILYSGVWSRFEQMRSEKEKEAGKA